MGFMIASWRGEFCSRARRVGRSTWLVVALALLGCTRDEPYDASRYPAPAGPVVLFAVDGFEWDVALPLLAEGKLPHLAGLMQRGYYGELETFQPTASPVIWTSVATGKGLEKHGIRNFAKPASDGGERLFNNRDRQTKAIWNILSDYDRTVATIGWWMTYPVEEINGVMVAQTNTVDQIDMKAGKNIWKGMLRDGVPGQVFPVGREEEMLAVLRRVEAEMDERSEAIFGELEHPLAPLDRRLWENTQWSLRADATYLEIARKLLGEQPPADLTLVYFGGPDVVGHRFWRYMQPDLYRFPPNAEQIANFGNTIRDYYIYTDQALGELMAASPPETTFFVVSDHGMRPVNFKSRFNPNAPPANINSGDHRDAPPGIFVAAGPQILPLAADKPVAELVRRDLTPVGSVLDIAPTLLAMMRIPLGADMDGGVLSQIFRAEADISQQPRALASHDTPEFLADRDPANVLHPQEAERLRQLRSLGYIGDDAGEQE